MNDTTTQSPPSVVAASKPSRGRFNFWRWFWLSTLVVSLVWVWHDFYVPSNNIAWANSYTSAQQQAAQSGKPLLLFFTGKWCVPCRIMKRTVWADNQVMTSVNAGFVPVTIDIDTPNEATVLSRYRFGMTPTTIITDPQGKVLQQVEGGIDKKTFLELLRKWSPSTTPLTP